MAVVIKMAWHRHKAMVQNRNNGTEVNLDIYNQLIFFKTSESKSREKGHSYQQMMLGKLDPYVQYETKPLPSTL